MPVAAATLILTLDYEIFGNGVGDVKKDIIEPTRRILAICDAYQFPLTIMFEVAEYWAFLKYDGQLRRDLGYSPSNEMEIQIINAVKAGHDVQLHVHPQWLNARYDQEAWDLGNQSWRLSDVPSNSDACDETKSLPGVLDAGKQTLERILKPVKQDYECVCLRAGGFYAQPSGGIISAMKRAGLVADSSVVPGYHASSPLLVDYRQTPANKGCWWTGPSELTVEGTAGEHVLELPVSSITQRYWKNFKPTKLLATLKRQRRESAAQTRAGRTIDEAERSAPAYTTALGKMFAKHVHTFDFCKLSSSDMLKRIDDCQTSSISPIVAIGHSKDFWNDKHLARVLQYLGERDSPVRVLTISQIVNRCRVSVAS